MAENLERLWQRNRNNSLRVIFNYPTMPELRRAKALRGPDLGILLITHYQRLLNYIVPDVVHVLVEGRIAKSGGRELALELEAKGYDWLLEEAVA